MKVHEKKEEKEKWKKKEKFEIIKREENKKGAK